VRGKFEDWFSPAELDALVQYLASVTQG
jgi:hypothetical protein